ncbi:MAG: MoaD/ThiS family protein [Chloroflexi bacterium]|nr:MoaD/ThiS family protein [Chloroflexota bacterium]
MIQVRVRLYATLRQYQPHLKIGETYVVYLPAGATVKRLIANLGIPPDTVKLVFSGGRAVEDDHVLCDGEDLGMFPPVAGG